MKILKILALLTVLMCPFKNAENVNQKFSVDKLTYEAALNQTNALKSLSIEGAELPFSEDILEYTLEVPYSISEAKIQYKPYYDGSIVEIVGGKELFLGNNSIAVIVTSGYDGSIREYDITLIRKSDIIEVENKSSSIENALNNSDSSTVSVKVEGDATRLATSTVKSLKDSLKTLVYNWNDSKGNFSASLTIDGSKINNINEINPNIKKEITDEKLVKYVEGYEYTPISTVNSNLPDGSTYKIAIYGKEDTYYLYYYDGDVLNKKPLRNINGTVEFEVKDGLEYALMVSALHPERSVSRSGTFWIWPSIIVTILVIIVFLITRYILVKILRVPSIPTEEELKVEKKKK